MHLKKKTNCTAARVLIRKIESSVKWLSNNFGPVSEQVSDSFRVNSLVRS